MEPTYSAVYVNYAVFRRVKKTETQRISVFAIFSCFLLLYSFVHRKSAASCISRS